jgi:hypothetical protein
VRQTDQVQEHRGNLRGDTVPQDPRSNEHTPPRSPVGPHTPDEATFETFVGGAGI